MPYATKQQRLEYTRRYSKEHPEVNERASRKYRSTEKARLKRKHYREVNKARIVFVQKRNNLKKYGITIEEHKTMVTAQNGLCAICIRPPGKKPLAVDHNHSTGKVRGLLCYRCNVSLGYFQEDIELIGRMINYIKHHNG